MVAVAYCGRPVGLETWIVTPLRVTRESTRSSAMSGPVSGKSRVPSPITTGYVSRMISSTRWLSNSQRTRRPLPCTCSSPAGLAFSSPMAAARSPERTVAFAQRGSESLVDATYLGFVFNAVQIGLLPGSAHDPQEPAKISLVLVVARSDRTAAPTSSVAPGPSGRFIPHWVRTRPRSRADPCPAERTVRLNWVEQAARDRLTPHDPCRAATQT